MLTIDLTAFWRHATPAFLRECAAWKSFAMVAAADHVAPLTDDQCALTREYFEAALGPSELALRGALVREAASSAVQWGLSNRVRAHQWPDDPDDFRGLMEGPPLVRLTDDGRVLAEFDA